jgi:hypothetical protein
MRGFARFLLKPWPLEMMRLVSWLACSLLTYDTTRKILSLIFLSDACLGNEL